MVSLHCLVLWYYYGSCPHLSLQPLYWHKATQGLYFGVRLLVWEYRLWCLNCTLLLCTGWGQNKPKISKAIWTPSIKILWACIDFWGELVRYPIHQGSKEVNTFKGLFGPLALKLYGPSSFLGQSAGGPSFKLTTTPCFQRVLGTKSENLPTYIRW